MKKRLLSMILLLCMVLTMLPTAVFAEDTEESPICTCETACTAENMNPECSVCGAEDALPEDCAQCSVEQVEEASELPQPQEGPAPQSADEGIAVQAAHTHCFCGGSVTAGDHTDHTDVTYTPCNNLDSIEYSDGTAYVYLTGNITQSYTLTVQEGKTLYLCLNGYSISGKGITCQGTVYLCDCSAAQSGTVSCSGSSCISVKQNAALYMYGGTLCDGNTKNTGGGAHVSGTMNLYSGTIRDNTASSDGGGIFVNSTGTLNLYGGMITGNKVSTFQGSYGGGVYVSKGGTISISGSPAIYGNTREYTDLSTNVTTTTTENLNLASNKYGTILIQLGALTSGANIGITAKKGSAFSTASEEDYSGYFFSDDSSYHVEYNEDKKLVLKSGASHVHSGGTATCTAKAICESCGEAYGELDPSNHSGTLSSNWSTDDAKHWKEYSCCHAHASEAVHHGGKATCQSRAVCGVCGVSYGELADHDYDTTKWGYTNKDGHAHRCTFCPAHDTILRHTPDHEGGATEEYPILCTDCGYEIEAQLAHSHSFTQEAVKPEALKSAATCTAKAVYYKSCACGEISTDDNDTFEYGELAAHDFTAETVDAKYLKSAATCTARAIYYKSCAVCGEKGTETFETGDVLGHDYGAWTSGGNGTHTRVCSHDASHTETEACTYGDNWETNRYSHWKTCTVCGGATEPLNHTDQDDDHLCDTCGKQITEHEFTAETVDAKYLKSAATCTAKAVYYKSCAVCGLSSKGTDSEATFEAGDILDHDYGEPSYTWTPVPDGYMCVASSKCKNCDADVADIATVTYAVVKESTCLTAGSGTYTATFSSAFGFPAQTKDEAIPATGHSWGRAEYTWTSTETGYDCTAKRVCQNDGTHVETETVTAAYTVVTEPTCLTGGLGRFQASFEADWAADASKDIPLAALGHTYGAWTSNGDGTHTRICSHDASHTETKDCHGGTANCHDKAVCTVCGQPYGKLAPAKHDGGTELKNKKDATCTEKGYTGDTYCKGCGEKLSDGKEIPVTEHSYGAWTIVLEPMACTKGERERTCESCDHKQSEVIPATGKFDDVPAGSYYEDAVIWAAREGITNGTDMNLFSPDAICTRAQAVTFLWRAAGSPAPMTGTMPFDDVPADSYYHDAVLWAVENGITKGTSETTFSPNANCTRAHTVTFLWRAEKSPAAAGSNPFTDVAANEYYAEAVQWAVENGITEGTGETTFSPNTGATRAQIVTFLWRCKK